MSLHRLARLRVGALLPVLLLGTACADQVAAPALAPTASAALALATPAVERIPNSMRYRDLGARPSTGRSGSAALSSFAVIGRDGITRLEVHSASAASPGVPAGTLAKVQVKRYGVDQSLLATTNHKVGQSSAAFTLPGLVRGSRVQVQANIRDIDRARTDVVTVIDTVRLRPDLAVTNLALPAELVAGVPTNITAVVRELNGDLGITTDCVLLVDGVEADRARRIWVDAGDAVTCAFTHVFTTGGNHAAVVRVEGSVPSDDDTSNDAVSGATHVTVEVDDAFAWQAIVNDYVATRDWTNRELTQNTVTGESYDWTLTGHDSVRVFTATFSGSLPHAITFPVERLELAQRSGGSSAHEATVEARGYDVETADGTRCANMQFGAGASAVLCSRPSAGATSLSYQRTGTATTYQGQYFALVWHGASGGLDSYTINFPMGNASASGAALGELVTDYEFSVRLTQGDWRFIQHAPVPIVTSGPALTGSPYSCFPDVVSGDSFRRFCMQSTATERSANGFASGAAVVP